MRTDYDSTPHTAPLAPLARDLECDVAVVGAGIAGLRIASELAAKGRHVVVLEAHHAGFGASGRNGGILFPAPGLVWRIPGALPDREAGWARDALDARLAAMVHELTSLDGGPARTAMVLAAPGAVSARALSWLAPSLPDARPCNSEELALRTGQRAQAALVFGAHVVHPRRFTLALLERARAAGVVVHGNTRVVDASDADRIVTERGHRVRARQVVVARGAWASRRSLQTWMLSSPPLDPATLAMLGSDVVATVDRAFTYRRVSNGRLLFGGLDDAVSAPRDDVPPDVPRRLRALLRRSIPALPPFEPECVWGGAIHARTHELPIVRRTSERVVEIGAVAGIYWALVGARLARGLVDPTLDTPDDARLRDAIEATRVPVFGALSLGARLVYEALRGAAA